LLTCPDLAKRRLHLVAFVAVLGLVAEAVFLPRRAFAIRPFVTDDARVVGAGRAQIETWFQADSNSTQHQSLLAFGPAEPFELTLGGLYGLNYERGASRVATAGPILQAKLLLREPKRNSWPGLAVAVGAVAPYGAGGFESEAWNPFTYAAATESLCQEDLLLHADLGFVRTRDARRENRALWGFGAQIRLVSRLHGVGEIFRGDPYSDNDTTATQLGFRYVASEHVQFDGSVGSGIDGRVALPAWGSLGIRLVSSPLW